MASNRSILNETRTNVEPYVTIPCEQTTKTLGQWLHPVKVSLLPVSVPSLVILDATFYSLLSPYMHAKTLIYWWVMKYWQHMYFQHINNPLFSVDVMSVFYVFFTPEVIVGRDPNISTFTRCGNYSYREIVFERSRRHYAHEFQICIFRGFGLGSDW